MEFCVLSSLPCTKGFCLCAVLGAAVLTTPSARSAPVAPPAPLHETFDIRYHDGGDRQLLDVIGPARAKGAAVVFFAHGGSWERGDKNFYGLYRGVGRFLAGHGFVAVLINYSLSPAVRHPEHVRDVARAYAWTRRHVSEFGGDPDRIFLAGHSAGGHLVALLATDERYLKAPELKLTVADRAAIKGVLSFSGVYRIPAPADFSRMAEDRLLNMLRHAGVDPNEAAGMSGLLLEAGKGFNPFRKAFGDDPELCKQASPLFHVRKRLPPFLLVNAAQDLPGLTEMAGEFAAALKHEGNTAEAVTVPRTNHSRIVFHLDEGNEEVAKVLLTFLERHSGPRKQP
jgi:acetyl esterase/lipase